MRSRSTTQARILFFDDNVRDIGGHYLELASLLAAGGRVLGYQTHLVSNETLLSRNPDVAQDTRLTDLEIRPWFSVRRMEHWSLGVDGRSDVMRDSTGAPNGGSIRRRAFQRLRDRWCRASKRPARMLSSWSETFLRAIREFRPGPTDRVVINTGSDFQMLALAAALREFDRDDSGPPLSIHVIFHFAVYDQLVDERAIQFGDQVNAMVSGAARHHIRLHATTESLRSQLQDVGVDASAIPYPTRQPDCRNLIRINRTPARVLLAGIPRAEKGRDEIKGLLQTIEQSQLRSGRLQWSMQIRSNGWQRVIPSSMEDLYRAGLDQGEDQSDRALELLQGNLTSDAYHQWLDSADVGLFLYEPQRYVARCSGVLLEMMIRGVPVIVPDACWLADQVRHANSSGPIGWIYRSIDEIPAILDRLPEQLSGITANSHRYAETIADRHSGRNTLSQMGLPPAGSYSDLAVG